MPASLSATFACVSRPERPLSRASLSRSGEAAECRCLRAAPEGAAETATRPRNERPMEAAMMRMLRAAAAASCLWLATAAPAAAATPADTLVVAKNIDDIVSLDPAQAFEFSGGEVLNNVYENLVQYEAEDTTRLAGGIAESWTVSEDGRRFVFELRDGLTFQSGNPVRPDDVVFSLARVITLNKAPACILATLGWTPEKIGRAHV